MDGPLKVLLVDNDPHELELIGNCLRDFNPCFEVDTTVSTGASIDKIIPNHYEAIVVDYGLAQEMHRDLKKITSKHSETPVIFLSSSDDKAANLENLNGGEQDFCIKDSSYLSMLPGVVQRAIEKNQLGQRLRESEKKNKELFEKVLSSKKRLQNLFDGIEDVICEVSPGCEILLANKACAELCKTKLESLIGQDYSKISANFGLDEDCPVSATIATLQPQSVERTRGDHIYDLYTYPIFNREGQLESVAVYARNVTEKKKFERTLIQSEKLATIGLLASGIAHELRNPLNVIETARYYIDEFLVDKKNDVAAKLEIISKNVKRASRIISSLLEFSRSSDQQSESLNLKSLVDATVTLTKKELDAKNIVYSFDGGADCFAYFNADSLKQVLLNVIINAIQAMPQGGELKIKMAQKAANQVQIKISDTGIGIPEKNLTHLFSPFFTTKDVGVGTGLGLYISHMILDREGGKISVSSKVNKGTTFTISLPIHEPISGRKQTESP